jgi:hypothetical protein
LFEHLHWFGETTEVLEWKQTLYEEIKDMSMADGLNYLLEKGRKAALRDKKPLSSFTN